MADLGIECDVITADADETPMCGEAPAALAARLARMKAGAVADRLINNGLANDALVNDASSDDGAWRGERATVVVAADTVVALDNAVLGKPVDASDARRMLALLRDRRHQVHSGVCVLGVAPRSVAVRVNTTAVEMRAYEAGEVGQYVCSGDPMDKAGAYAIQHPEFAPVRALDGCLSAVMGLPLDDMCEMLAPFGVEPVCTIAEVCERQAGFACCQRMDR